MRETQENEFSHKVPLPYQPIGVSEKLKQEFNALYDTSNIDGGKKFYDASVKELAKSLVCRNYANICYELAHLCWALVHTKQKAAILNYFWVDQVASSQSFVHYFRHVEFVSHSHTKIEILEQQVLRLQIHAHVFSISAKRANYLSCFMEWLLLVVPNLIDSTQSVLFGKGKNAIDEFASLCQKKIYAYLSEHLIPSKLQQKFRLLSAEYTNDSVKEPNVSDETILSAWSFLKNNEGFSKYTTFVKDTIHFVASWQIEQHHSELINAETQDLNQPKLDYSTKDTEGSFVQENTKQNAEQNELYTTLDSYAAESLDLDILSSELKVFNKAQLEYVSLLSQDFHVLRGLPISYLRYFSFGQAQFKLIQKSRSLKVLNKEDYAGIEASMIDYQQLKKTLVEIYASNQQALLAISYIVYVSAPADGLELAIKAMPSASLRPELKVAVKDCIDEWRNHQIDIDTGKENQNVNAYDKELSDEHHHANRVQTQKKGKLVSNAPLVHNVASIRQNSGSIMAKFENNLSQEAWYQDFLKQMQKAYKSVNRKGFTEQTHLPLDHYFAASEALFSLNSYLKKLLVEINMLEYPLEAKYDSDSSIFKDEFFEIYKIGS